MYVYVYIYICHKYEPPSKFIVDAWYENLDYRFLGGGLSLLLNCLFKSTLKAAELDSRVQICLNCWEWIKGRSVFAFVTMLGSLDIPRLFQ